MPKGSPDPRATFAVTMVTDLVDMLVMKGIIPHEEMRGCIIARMDESPFDRAAFQDFVAPRQLLYDAEARRRGHLEDILQFLLRLPSTPPEPPAPRRKPRAKKPALE